MSPSCPSMEVVSSGMERVGALCPKVVCNGKLSLILGNSTCVNIAHPVTVEAVDLVVGSVGEVAGVELVFAVVAGEALLVVEGALRNLLLSLEHAPAAPRRWSY